MLRGLNLEDPKAREHLNAVKRILAARFRRDANAIYDVFWKLVHDGTTKDDDPRVRLLMKVLDKFFADPREVTAIGGVSTGGVAFELHVHSPAGMEIRRGTREAREEAIEVQYRRHEAEASFGNGAAQEEIQHAE